MQVTLQLNTDRAAPVDAGHFLDLIGAGAWAQRQNDDHIWLESNSGYVILQPDWTYNSKGIEDFTLSDPDNWEEITACWLFSGPGLHHRSLDGTDAVFTAPLEINQASLVGLHIQEPTEQKAIKLLWGIQGGYSQLFIVLEPGKKPYAEMLDISETPAVADMTWEMTDGPVLDADALYGKTFFVVCMPLRGRLLLYSDLWGFWFITPQWNAAKPSYVVDGKTHFYCLRAGQFAVEAEAIFYLAARPLTYAEAGQFDIPFQLPYIPNVMPTSELDWEVFSGTGAMLQVLRANGDPYELGDTEGLVRVSMIGGPRTPILNKLLVSWDPVTTIADGDPVAQDILQAEEYLSADPGADSWRFILRPSLSDEGLWLRPNLPFAVIVDGDTTRMVGLTDTPTLAARGAEQPTVEMRLQSGLKRLQHALVAEGQMKAYDGATFTAAVTDLLALAGAHASEIHVGADTTTLPRAEDGKEPLYMFAPGVSIAQAIEQLRDDWNTDWLIYHAPDGFHVEPPPTGAPLYTFLLAREDRTAPADQVMRDLDLWSDDSQFVNYLVVWGRDDDGKLIHSTPLEDAASVTNPAADDYVGEWRRIFILNSSANTVAKCDLIAAKAWPCWNCIPRFARWRGAFVKTLAPYQLVTIEYQPSYLTIRLREMRTTFLPNLGLTDYMGEVVP